MRPALVAAIVVAATLCGRSAGDSSATAPAAARHPSADSPADDLRPTDPPAAGPPTAGPPTAAPTAAEPPAFRAAGGFPSIDAVQGVAVDARHVYTVSNRAVSRHDGASGARERRRVFARDAAGPGAPIVHLNGGVVHAGRLYAAHSDWPRVPTASAVEVFDTATLARVASHPFGTRRGALTWLDRHAGRWWAVFTDYGRVPPPAERGARELVGTRLVAMDEAFAILRVWRFPGALLRRLAPMSNSGGSWGPDGRLWLTGHDRAEAYVVVPPADGDALEWRATVALPGVEGQGIAWRRDAEAPALYGVRRSRRHVVRLRPARGGAAR